MGWGGVWEGFGRFWDGKVHDGKWSQEVSFLSEMWICGLHPIGSWLAEVKTWYQDSSFKGVIEVVLKNWY